MSGDDASSIASGSPEENDSSGDDGDSSSPVVALPVGGLDLGDGDGESSSSSSSARPTDWEVDEKYYREMENLINNMCEEWRCNGVVINDIDDFVKFISEVLYDSLPSRHTYTQFISEVLYDRLASRHTHTD